MMFAGCNMLKITMDPKFICYSDHMAIPVNNVVYVNYSDDKSFKIRIAPPSLDGTWDIKIKEDKDPNCYKELMRRFAFLAKQ